MKKRSECNCPCHQNSSIMHIAPCCEPDPMKEKTKMSAEKVLSYDNEKFKHLAKWLAMHQKYEEVIEAMKEYASINQSENQNKAAKVVLDWIERYEKNGDRATSDVISAQLRMAIDEYEHNDKQSEWISVEDEQIFEHIVKNCRSTDGRELMDEQAFYEGAKWMREQINSTAK